MNTTGMKVQPHVTTLYAKLLFRFSSSVKSKAKEEAQEQRLINLENRVIEMDFSNEQLRAQLRQFEREMHASPLRALKEKFAPATTASKPDQKSASGASSGTRIVTLERAAIFPNGRGEQHSIDETSKYLPVPQWRRPFAGSTSASTTTPPSTSSGGSPSTNQESTKPSNGTPSSQFGSVNAGVESSGAVSEHRVVKSSISGKGDDQYRNKMVRRAIKILMDAYEETVDED